MGGMKEIPPSYTTGSALQSPADPGVYCPNCDAHIKQLTGPEATCPRCWHWFIVSGSKTSSHRGDA